MFNETSNIEHGDHASWITSLCSVLAESRPWHAREQDNYPLHPVISKALSIDWPTDWKRVILEWPHVAVKETGRLAYTRDEQKGERDLQTVTTIGKYLKQHWPDFKDDLIQSMVYKFTAKGCTVFTTSDDIVRAVQEGPRSCMQWSHRDTEEHPYRAYAPELGWGCAVRLNEDGRIDARALVFEAEVGLNAFKGYVRSYRRPEDNDNYSGSCFELEAWLEENGYSSWDSWPIGILIAKVSSAEFSHGNMFPFLDGNRNNVDEYDSNSYVITSCGQWICDNTDGDAGHNYNHVICDRCDNSFHEDDTQYLGSYVDVTVCQTCRDRYYTLAYGTGERSNGQVSEYLIREHDVLLLCGIEYDENNLPHYIIDCDHGGYAHEDLVVTCCVTDETYCDKDHPDLVDLGDWRYCRDDQAFECQADGEYYLFSEVDPVEIDGRKYHPKNAPAAQPEVELPVLAPSLSLAA